jgi:glutathione S-transferase
VGTTWRDILADYIARINEKAYDRLTEEWPVLDLPGSQASVQAEREVGKLADIHTSFVKFADSRPNACEHMQEKLENVRQSLLAHINDDLTDVRIAIWGWQGPVARAVRGYVGECETAVVWHLDYVEAMSGIAELQKEIVDRTRDDVRSIADALLEALEKPVDEGSSFSLGDAFTVAAAVAAVAVAVATPLPGDEAAAAAVAATLLSRVKSVFDAGASAAAALRTPEFEGERTIDILESAYRALNKIVDAVEQQEGVVVEALTALSNGFVENEAALVPQRQPVDINSVSPTDVLAVNPEEIRMAARNYLPTVAGDNRNAALHLASIEENEPFAFEGELHGGPLARWRARREELQRILGDNASALEDMAATLETIASTYADNEAAQAEGFGGISSRLENS